MPRLQRLGPVIDAGQDIPLSPAEFDAGGSRLLERAGNAVQGALQATDRVVRETREADERLREAEADTRATLRMAELSASMVDLRSELQSDDDLDTQENRFLGEFDRLAGEAEEGLDGLRLERVRRELGVLRARQSSVLRQEVRARRNDRVLANLVGTSAAMERAIASETDPNERERLFSDHREEIEIAVDTGALTRTQAAQQIESFESSARARLAAAERERLVQGTVEGFLSLSDDQGELLSDGAQVEAARGIRDPELQRQVVKFLKVRQGERAAIEKEREREAVRAGWAAVDEGASLDDILAMEDLSRDDQDRMISAIESESFANAGRRGPRITDPIAYQELKRMAREEPGRFQNVNLGRVRHVLGPREWGELVEQQRVAQAGGDAFQDNALSGADTTLFLRMMTNAEIPKRGPIRDEILLRAERALDARRKNAGRDLTRAERLETFEDLLQETDVPGFFGFFTNSVRTARLTTGEAESILGDASHDIHQEAIDQLQAIGVNQPTPQEIEDQARQILEESGIRFRGGDDL